MGLLLRQGSEIRQIGQSHEARRAFFHLANRDPGKDVSDVSEFEHASNYKTQRSESSELEGVSSFIFDRQSIEYGQLLKADVSEQALI